MLDRHSFDLANRIERFILASKKEDGSYFCEMEIFGLFVEYKENEGFDKAGIYCICPFSNAHVFIGLIIDTNEQFLLFKELQRRSWESKLVRL